MTTPDHVTDPPPGGPICPHCGGGPILATGLGLTCKSCARIVMPRRAPRPALDELEGDELEGDVPVEPVWTIYP